MTTDETQDRQGSTLSGFASVVDPRFSSETDVARASSAENDARPTEIATNGKRQKRDNEHRNADNPKRGAHTNWVGASMVHRDANDIVTLSLGRL